MVTVVQAQLIVHLSIVQKFNVSCDCVAPVGNFLGMRFTYRVTVMIGAAIACISAFLASFATNIYYVIIVFGLLTGYLHYKQCLINKK